MMAAKIIVAGFWQFSLLSCFIINS